MCVSCPSVLGIIFSKYFDMIIIIMVEGDVLPRPCTCGILKGGKVFSVPFEGFQDIYDEY